MTEQPKGIPDLATLLCLHREEITAAWAKLVHEEPGSPYGERPLDELYASAGQGVEAVVEALSDTGSCTAMERYLTDVCMVRLETGFGIADVIEALLLCKEAILPVIWRGYASNPAVARDSIARLDACLRWASGHVGELYATEMSRRLREQQERAALMLEMARAASSSLDLDAVLRRVAEGMASAVGVRHCGFYLMDENQGLLLPRRGTGTLPTAAAVRAFLSLPLDPSTNAFIRQVLESREPLVSPDAQSDSRLSPEGREAARLLGIRSMLVVPLVVQNRALGLVTLNTFDEPYVFTEEQIELAQGIADAVALAIENARLYQQVRQLAVLEERDRLAREMHDRLAQSLSYLNLKTSVTNELLSGGQIDQAQASLLELKRVARETYMDVREAIFGLRARVSPELGFLVTLREYLDEYQTHYGVDVDLALEDESLAEFPPDVAIQVTRIVQEALANVRKHAGTNKARIGIDREGDEIRISVEDDGHGFDLVQTAGGGGDYFGLQIMRERAESVGGSLEIHSLPDQGTRVVLRVPRTLQD